jgi:2-desacetyl-2-hydroxyethyl bacteriochlorophyllide A dehydrogenase
VPTVVQFVDRCEVAVAEEPPTPLTAGAVRVSTWFSGISAGTEMTAYRGLNPYVSKSWDPRQRLFTAGPPAIPYPSSGWGYEEVGQVIEVASGVTSLDVGDVVHGAWGHRSEAVVPAERLVGHRMPDGVPAIRGVFARAGAVALNAVIGADVHVGEEIAVFGQGVMGLLATRLATLNGGTVVAVDRVPERLELARRFGAATVVDADVPGGAALDVRAASSSGAGVDSAIELSGSYRGLHEAVRSVVTGGRVIAAGFYQGEGIGLSLGEEFHHNRVEIVASQIGAAPRGLAGRWDTERLLHVFMRLVADGAVDVASLVSHVIDAADAASAYRLLDTDPDHALQVVLRFPPAPTGQS